MEKLKPFLPWIYRAIGLLVVVLLVLAWNDARSSKDALRKELEAEKLIRAKLIVETEASVGELQGMADSLMKGNSDLEEEVARLKDTLGKPPKVVEVIKWRTKEVLVDGPTITIPCPGGGSVECLLPPGSTWHVEAGEITYKTKENNRVIVGTASCWRDTPAPAAKLFSSAFSADLTTAATEKVDPDPFSGWGAGIRGGVDKGGWTLGPALAFPPLPFLFKTRVEIGADAGFGPAGNYQVGITAILRK